ncbi:MAG: Zn-dependent hydrolase [Actinomycetota bacterium]|nr:Zn-dependent hydrolase [Actinomycetota bacterium]
MRVVIDAERLQRRLAELAAIGAIEGTEGCARLALTDADRDGRDLVTTWMRDLGLHVAVDAIGNVYGVLGAETVAGAVLTGSHIDTVATGGRYDGNLGVLAGLEVIESVLDAGIEPARPLAVAFFTNEEGARFAPDMLGSLVYAGGLQLEEALDAVAIDGAVLGDELDRIGYRGTSPVPGPVPHAFVEYHIEQGPVLEREGVGIGAVTGVQGISWTQYTFTGQSNHAGTTPMSYRRDPGLVAMRVGAFVRDLVDEIGPPQVGTVGRIELHPNLVNVVAARATITVDVRNTDDTVLAGVEAKIAEFVRVAAADEDVEVASETLARFEPVEFDPFVVDLVEEIAGAAGHTTMRLPAGAGHDAQMMARICPAGMIFVPSVNGISHNPAEHTEPDDIAAGADVLARTMLRLAAMPADSSSAALSPRAACASSLALPSALDFDTAGGTG